MRFNRANLWHEISKIVEQYSPAASLGGDVPARITLSVDQGFYDAVKTSKQGGIIDSSGTTAFLYSYLLKVLPNWPDSFGIRILDGNNRLLGVIDASQYPEQEWERERSPCYPIGSTAHAVNHFAVTYAGILARGYVGLGRSRG